MMPAVSHKAPEVAMSAAPTPHSSLPAARALAELRAAADLQRILALAAAVLMPREA